MSSPAFLYQMISGEIYRQIANFIMENDRGCRPFVSPADVQLDCDKRTMLQPDIGILCDRGKIKKWGVYGAPDFLAEITSPSTKRKDNNIVIRTEYLSDIYRFPDFFSASYRR